MLYPMNDNDFITCDARDLSVGDIVIFRHYYGDHVCLVTKETPKQFKVTELCSNAAEQDPQKRWFIDVYDPDDPDLLDEIHTLKKSEKDIYKLRRKRQFRMIA